MNQKIQPEPQDIFDRMWQEDYCSQWMGLQLVHLESGHCEMRMKVRKEMLNGFGILHGGIAYAFADSVFAFASNSLGKQAVSIHGDMHYHRSAKEGTILKAIATPLSIGNAIAQFDVVIQDEEGTDYYHFRGTVFRNHPYELSQNQAV